MIEDVFTDKQIKALKNNARILVLHGAKRTGKTYVLIVKFLMLVAKFRNKGYKFIIGGATSSTIRANILDDMEKIIEKEIKLDVYKSFELFGNKILVRAGANSDSWKTVRGFTAYGCLLNEGTALNKIFVQECISRCSGEGARIFIDTNPDNPFHYIKTDYIDKSGELLESGQPNIQEIQFQLDDNSFLDPIYVESIKKATPSGLFYDRDILGQWVNSEGVVYKDFDQKAMVKSEIPKCSFYMAGVDWGYEHYGTIYVIGITANGEYWLVEEIVAQHQEIDFWVNKAKEIINKYGNIPFYCDSARPEHVARFLREGFRTHNADKSILSGIEVVAKLMKQKKFYVSDKCKHYLKEVYNYVWDEKTGMPVKANDDGQDAVRYAIYTYSLSKQTTDYYKKLKGVNYLDKRAW
ncbi:PBSX family phage terminase large subunit [Fusobacterium perfoetens]|uniref:PBSX family phage terminase large subunit n=1 Tax=Fusobacterium perfoetens TaxID=852 RepID=UPI001F206ACF|nr:PBSX family phage terminase large subunit [Fusobacterium perfoetens]MCF2625270.1 PBSX family phage terminase large subunit [Fusobacterium perfoetens]